MFLSNTKTFLLDFSDLEINDHCEKLLHFGEPVDKSRISKELLSWIFIQTLKITEIVQNINSLLLGNDCH